MIHATIAHHLVPRSEEELINHLAPVAARGTWTRCDGSLCYLTEAPYPVVVVNDSFSEDGAQEYAFLRVIGGELPSTPPATLQSVRLTVEQIESLTVSWCEPDTVSSQIATCLRSGATYGPPFSLTVTLGPDHECALCA